MPTTGAPTAGELRPLGSTHIQLCSCNSPAAAPPGSEPSNRVGIWCEEGQMEADHWGSKGPFRALRLLIHQVKPSPGPHLSLGCAGCPASLAAFDKGRAPSGPPHRPPQPSIAPRHPWGWPHTLLAGAAVWNPEWAKSGRAQGAQLPTSNSRPVLLMKVSVCPKV